MGEKSKSANHSGLSVVVLLVCLALTSSAWMFREFIFPYTGLMVRESNYTGRSIFPEDLGKSLNVLQWSLVAIGFSHLTRKISIVALIPLAFGCVVIVTFVSELIFRFIFDVDQSFMMRISKPSPEPTETTWVYVATAIVGAGYFAMSFVTKQRATRLCQPLDPTL